MSDYFENIDEIQEDLIDHLIEENKKIEVQSRTKINKAIQEIIDDLRKRWLYEN